MVQVRETARRIVPVGKVVKRTAPSVMAQPALVKTKNRTKNNQEQNQEAPRTTTSKVAAKGPVVVLRPKRDRVQTTLYQVSAPAKKSPKSPKKPVPKVTKKVADKKDKNNNKAIKKVDAGKIKKGAKKAAGPKPKGNERLKKRDGIKVEMQNPFIYGSSVPEFVSINTYHRWLIRALVRGNLKELQTVMKSNKISDLDRSFSYNDSRSADSLILLTGDTKLMEEFYKLKGSIDAKKLIDPEPNMLQRKTTGNRNYYMLGRNTRAVETGRGGREGNNAFLNYETQSSRYDSDALTLLVENDTEYKDLLRISRLKNSPFQMHQLETHVVTAVRRGHCELAQALACQEAQYACNELHRVTLKISGKLPSKIMAVSVVKKCFGNKNITPLHTAAINPNGAKMLEQLRTVDPNINIPDQDNWYTVHYAAVNRHPGALEFLLRNGAAPSMLNKRHQSPLHVAVIAGRAETTKVLLEAIAKLERGEGGTSPQPSKSLINARTRDGDTALHLAVKYRRLEVAEILLANEHTLVDAPTSATTNKLTPLMLACASGNLEIAKLLVEKDALIEAKDKKKRSALHHSVLNGQEHTAAYLLSMGCDVRKRDSSGNTPAHYASAYGWLDCLQLLALIDPGCLSQENDWKITPLTVAFLKGHYGIVSWLLDGEHKDSVDINAKDSEGYTLLSCLLAFSDPDVHNQLPEQIDYLLSRGADCTLTDSYDNTILHDFASLNIKLVQPGEKEKKGMTEQQMRYCFDRLGEKVPSVCAKNQAAMTPLHVALKQGCLKVFNWLLEKVDIKEVNKDKWQANDNILHALLRVPGHIWRAGDWTRGSPPRDLYDILPILQKLQKACPSEFVTWTQEKNEDYREPVLAFLFELTQLNHKGLPDEDSKPFIAYACQVVSWFSEIQKDTPSLYVEKTDTRANMSLLAYSYSIGLEDGSLQMLETILKKAVDNGIVERVLLQKFNDAPVVFLPLTWCRDIRPLLRVAKENSCTQGVHNAIMTHEGEGTERKEVQKTLLMSIIEQRSFDLVPELVLTLDDWKAKDAKGNTAWHYVAKSNHHRTLSLMKMLESRGIPREVNNYGQTPLHVAVEACDGSANAVLEPIEWLVNKSQVADQDIYGRTAMHYAFATPGNAYPHVGDAQMDPIAVVSVLAMNITEEQLNVADNMGNTALHLAAACGANICAVTLLRKGAKVTAKNKDGNTPLALAVLKNRQGVALTLIQANSNVTDQVFMAQKKEDEKKAIQWIWNCLKKEETLVPNSTIPAQIVKRGTEWAAMVYVLLDTLGKNTSSMAQITACALKEGQYNLANQLLKSLEAILDGKSLNSEEDLMVIFAEGSKGRALPHLTQPTEFKSSAIGMPKHLIKKQRVGRKNGIFLRAPVLPPATDSVETKTLESESVERTILERLLNIGCPIGVDGACPALEIALFNVAWPLANFLKEQMGEDAWNQLKPVHPDEGPLKALLLTGCTGGSDFSKWIDLVKNMKMKWSDGKSVTARHCSMTLPLPKTLTGLVDGMFTAMGFAALHANASLIYLLRNRGFDVNGADELGRTPLMLAVLANEQKALEALCSEKLWKEAEVKKDKNVVKMKMSLGNHLAFTLNGRKRKHSDDEGSDEGEDEGSDSETEDEEENEESETEENAEAPAKKLKISNKQLSLDARDHRGRNVLHYLVEPVAWENVDLLKQLASEDRSMVKKLLLQKDRDGNTPTMLAANRIQRRMCSAMAAISGQTVPIPEVKLAEVGHLHCCYDISADSAEFIRKFAEENDKKKTKESEDKPHKRTGYSETGVVVRDDKTDQYFKVLLNKADLSYGRYGFHNFYRMELVKRRDTNLWNVFTNWGRIGAGDGEYQNTPFGSLEAAGKEFCSVFKSKTGQEWLPLDRFKDVPKKYRLVKVDKSPNSLAELELPALKKVEEEDEVRAFVKDISDPAKLKEYQNAIRHNLSICSPFGRITKEAISVGREILKDCELIAKQILEATQDRSLNQEKILRLLNQANDLSSEFYSTIPIGNAEYSGLKRFDEAEAIKQVQTQLNRLSEVEIAARILTAAAERQDVERISYIQSAMECGLRAMTPDEEMSQYILQWVHNTKNETHTVKGILEITPKRSVERFQRFANEDKQMFLLHGTRAVNLMSLLRDGFLVDPQNTQINGRLFGDGIYLADCFGKSHAYCQDSSRGWKYMLVCQVSLGKNAVRDKDMYKEENLKSQDSLHMRGTFYPKCSMTVGGVSMPLGEAKETKSTYGWRNNYSEFIVRDPERVLPRFLIMYK